MTDPPQSTASYQQISTTDYYNCQLIHFNFNCLFCSLKLLSFLIRQLITAKRLLFSLGNLCGVISNYCLFIWLFDRYTPKNQQKVTLWLFHNVFTLQYFYDLFSPVCCSVSKFCNTINLYISPSYSWFKGCNQLFLMELPRKPSYNRIIQPQICK